MGECRGEVPHPPPPPSSPPPLYSPGYSSSNPARTTLHWSPSTLCRYLLLIQEHEYDTVCVSNLPRNSPGLWQAACPVQWILSCRPPVRRWVQYRFIISVACHSIRVGIFSPAMRRGIDSRNRVWKWVVKLHRLADRYDNPMPTWFLAPIAGLKCIVKWQGRGGVSGMNRTVRTCHTIADDF